MSRPWAVLLSVVLVMSIGIGTLEAGAGKRHRHRVKTAYRSAATHIGGNDVKYVIARCPGGYRAIAVSGDTDTIAYSNGTELDLKSGTTWWINDSSIGGTVHAKVTCLRSKTTARQASADATNARERNRKLELLRATQRK
ncbi:MAG: hypothetical protein ABR581_02345 [Thermoleophilaceae bacterium]